MSKLIGMGLVLFAGCCSGCDSAVVAANTATVLGASGFIFSVIDKIGAIINGGA